MHRGSWGQIPMMQTEYVYGRFLKIIFTMFFNILMPSMNILFEIIETGDSMVGFCVALRAYVPKTSQK